MKPKVSPQDFWRKLKGTVILNDEMLSRRSYQEDFPIDNKKHIAFKVNDNDFLSEEYKIGLEFILSCTYTMHELFESIFLDFDKSDLKKISSIDKNYDIAIIKKDNRYDMLSTINLYEHTMNVVIEVLEITKSMPSVTKDICILLTLLHDIGKCKRIQKKYSFGEKLKHHIVSANYSRIIMQDLMFQGYKEINEELIELVYLILKEHHYNESSNEDTKFIYEHNMFIEILKKADYSARRKELATIFV